MNNFYCLIHKEQIESGIRFIIKLNPDHIIYKGHFPEIAIVPGAALIDIVKELVGITLNKEVRTVEITSVKFVKVILPTENEELEIVLHVKEESEIFVKTQINVKGKACFKLNAVYAGGLK